MSTDLRVAAGRQWVTSVVYGVLGLELAAIVVFAATYNALDFRIYMWGGHAMLGDGQLYLTQAYGHWFTYSPFAALVYAPAAALPLAVARVCWDLLSVAALAWSGLEVLRLAGYRPTRTMVAGLTAAAIILEPVWQTLFLGQINLILLALILTDMRRLAQGRVADSNTVGIGIGIAAAIKLTPAIFIVFLLLARRARAALVAAAAFVACGLTGCFVAPDASRLYWRHLFFDTHRVGAPYISNQSPYGAAIRIASGQGHIGGWWIAVPLVLAAIGLTTAVILARRYDWLAATAVTGTTGLLVSPISWAHHWVWVIPALVLLLRSGHRIAAGAAYLLFAVAPFWFTPHAGGSREDGFHGLLTLAANCYLVAGLAFVGYLTWQARRMTWPEPELPAPHDANMSQRIPVRISGELRDGRPISSIKDGGSAGGLFGHPLSRKDLTGAST
jgi:Glycosyltransferase family 87